MKPVNRVEDSKQGGAPVSSGVCFSVDSDGSNSVLRALPVAIIVSEAATGKVLEANPAALALLGLQRDALLGKSLPEAGVDLVIDYGIGGRKGSRAQEAIVTDNLGTRISCRLITSTADITGQRVVLSVILDSQLQAVLMGRVSKGRQSRQEASEQHERKKPKAASRSVAILADPVESPRESAAEMLRMLGLTVFSGASLIEAISGMTEGSAPSLLVVDCLLVSEVSRVAADYPGARVIVAGSGPSARDEISRRGWFEVSKPYSINELASAVSRALG